MNIWKTVLKWITALAAVAGTVYLVIRYMDKITEWLSRICPCKEVPTVEKTADAPVQEEPGEDEPVEVPEEEVIAREPVDIPDGEPVAEEADFEA